MKTISTLAACVVGVSFASTAIDHEWLDVDSIRHTSQRQTQIAWKAPIYIEAGTAASSTEIANISIEDTLPADRIELAKHEIRTYQQLEEDWDMEGGVPPTQGDIADALAFLDTLPAGFAIPSPMISSSGEIGLYWDAPDFYADAAFEGDGALSLFTKFKTSGEKHLIRVAAVRDLTKDWFEANLSPTRKA